MKNFTMIVGLLFVMSVGSAFAKENPDCDKDSHYPLVTKSELKEITTKKSAFIVDVNSDESFAKANVPGSIHFVDKKAFAQALPKDKNTLIVAYCGGPACEAWKTAAKEACNMGYTNVHHFKEGISGWTKKD